MSNQAERRFQFRSRRHSPQEETWEREERRIAEEELSEHLSSRLGPMHAHEALDRTSVLGETFEAQVLRHPYIQQHPLLRLRAEAIAEAIGELYEAVGEKNFEEFP